MRSSNQMKLLDTYALVEIRKGKENYKKYLEEEWCTLTVNVTEFFYSFLKEGEEKLGKKAIELIKRQIRTIPIDVAMQAALFKYRHKTKKFSYIDALSYTYAQTNNIPFVTGNKQFKGMKGVEFVKA